jgi:salicylate hydroxylase
MVESSLKWPLLSGHPLKSWVHDKGKLLIIGDAAHAMVPYMSQGKSAHIGFRILVQC